MRYHVESGCFIRPDSTPNGSQGVEEKMRIELVTQFFQFLFFSHKVSVFFFLFILQQLSFQTLAFNNAVIGLFQLQVTVDPRYEYFSGKGFSLTGGVIIMSPIQNSPENRQRGVASHPLTL